MLFTIAVLVVPRREVLAHNITTLRQVDEQMDQRVQKLADSRRRWSGSS